MSMARTLLLRARRATCLPASLHPPQENKCLFALRALSSLATAAAEPVTDTASLIPGRADSTGTAQYAQRIGSAAGPGHFRQLKAGGQLGDLAVSSLGIGTFGGSELEEVDREYIKTITRGFDLGINFID
eukprot:c21103_g1_i1 orf=2-388(-)